MFGKMMMMCKLLKKTQHKKLVHVDETSLFFNLFFLCKLDKMLAFKAGWCIGGKNNKERLIFY